MNRASCTRSDDLAVWRACLFLFLVLSWSPAPEAGTVRDSRVHNDDGVYRIEMDLEIEADVDAVYGIITDYANMHRISNLLTESSVMETPEHIGIRRRLVSEICILVFCFDSVMVEDVEEIGGDTIRTTLIPEQSDFISGHSHWHIQTLDEGRSLLRFRYEIQPDFWIPPVIGALLIKRKLLREAEETIEIMEALAREE